ncbi:MAG: 50S ribosomal protein L22 [Bacteroidia bacterium]|jgi:large subunit ribosomal protein L22|nr:50S ribosomal protein L22 [Bacteroidia bacterium]
MGSRKKKSAELLKQAKNDRFQSVLRDCPTSPRKMRLVTDMIRGMAVNRALDVLKFSSKEASRRVEKLLLSAIANWQAKNEGVRLEESNLYVQEVFVDSARMLKRLRPAPQGRGHRIRKRSNHVTVRLASKNVVAENTK